MAFSETDGTLIIDEDDRHSCISVRTQSAIDQMRSTVTSCNDLIRTGFESFAKVSELAKKRLEEIKQPRRFSNKTLKRTKHNLSDKCFMSLPQPYSKFGSASKKTSVDSPK